MDPTQTMRRISIVGVITPALLAAVNALGIEEKVELVEVQPSAGQTQIEEREMKDMFGMSFGSHYLDPGDGRSIEDFFTAFLSRSGNSVRGRRHASQRSRSRRRK